VLLIGFAGIGMTFPPNYVFSPEFGTLHYLYRLVYIYISFSSRRFQFYAAFRLIESTCIAAGLGFNGYDNKTEKWDRIIGGMVTIIETECDPAIVIKVRTTSLLNFNSIGTTQYIYGLRNTSSLDLLKREKSQHLRLTYL